MTTDEMNEHEFEQTLSLSPSRQYLPFLLVLFVGSGCSALIYEVVWFQMLQLVVGSSPVSLGVLLGTFMGGMFLGSIALPRLISTRAHPLRVYSILELGIGVIGITVLFGIPYLDRLYIAFLGHGFAWILLRGFVCAVILLPPTLLMGATLPVIARWVKMTPQGVSWLGFFYAGNIAGAVFGCLLAGFFLLRVFDISTATYVAVFINVAVAAACILLASRTPYLKPASVPVQEHSVRAPGFQLVYFAIALSGLCALGAEVVWTRLLSLLLGGTVYTFSIILAVFLSGLGIGSSVGSFILRTIDRPRAVLGLCQLLLTVAITWAAYTITHFLPYWSINSSYSPNPWYAFLLDLLRCSIAILPAAVFWGASFPLALASVPSRSQEPGRLVGEVYAANTFGAIIGAIGFSMLAIPYVGTQQSQRLMIGLSGATALVMFVSLLWPSGTPVFSTRRFRVLTFRFASAFVVVGLTVVLAWNVPTTPWGMAAYGRKLSTRISQLAPEITVEQDVPSIDGIPDVYCTFFGEGMSESVAVTKMRNGVRNFHAAGKVQASSQADDMRLQRMLGHITALTHKNPRSVLVVACGAGVTAGTFVLYLNIERIVICEIEKLVPEFVAPQFKKENYGVVNDPRTELIIDDGRHFIQTTHEKFDIITSDPIDPWIKGSAALYTEDYFAICREHLNQGGVMALWIPFYESSPESVKSLIATFFRVFPEGIIWSNDTYEGGYDAVLFGQKGQTKIDVDEVQKRLNSQDFLLVAQSLRDVGFKSAIDLFSTFAGCGPKLEKWLNHAQINTDRNLRLQYLAGMSLNYSINIEILNEIFLYYSFPYDIFRGSDQSILELTRAMQYKSFAQE
ncbi:MAG: SAM-dependent methyltransferase [Parcubacteria group bacterium]